MPGRRDRRSICRDPAWGLVGLALVWGCVREAPEPIGKAPARVELWVDEYAAAGGDGTKQHPFKRLPEELPERVDLHLKSGLYEGPFVFPRDARVEGHGQVVLHAEAPAVVVTGGALELVHVSVQGGAVGVAVTGRARLEAVHVSGHREAGVRVGDGGTLEVVKLEVEGTIPEALGVWATGATVSVEGAQFRGDLKQAIRVEGGTARLEDVRSEGGRTLVQAMSAELTLSKARAAAGRGAAVLVSGGVARVTGLEVDGHEVALNALSQAKVDAQGLRSRRPYYAGVVFVGASGTLRDVEVSGAGPGGGVQALDSDLRVEDAHVTDSMAMGVFVRKGRARLVRVTVERLSAEANADGTRALGDALMLRDAEVEVEQLAAREVEGSALYASAFATVRVGTLLAERTGGGALLVERGASVTVKELTSRGTLGPVVTVPDKAKLSVDRLVVSGGAEVPVYAACEDGAEVRLGRLDSTVPQPPAKCVRLGP
ncbi:MAG: hypothetical protein IT380_01375 [Myxococcales bacterium]|nr:hypothetical protein [Myxococcales bacterium]